MTTRRIKKLSYAGFVISAMIAATLLANYWWVVGYEGQSWVGALAFGGASVFIGQARASPAGWMIERNNPADLGPCLFWGLKADLQSPEYNVFVPLWIPFILILVPSLHAWRVGRKIPPGCCRECRYNLTGNLSGVCPECGTEINHPGGSDSRIEQVIDLP